MKNKIKNLFNKKGKTTDGVNTGYDGEVEFKGAGKDKEEKPSIIIKVGVFIIILGVMLIGMKYLKNSKTHKQPHAPVNKELTKGDIQEEKTTNKELINKNLLAYNRDGYFTLYDENEKLIDELGVFKQETNFDDEESEEVMESLNSLSLLNKGDDYGLFKTNKGDIFLVFIEGDKIQYRNVLNQRKDVTNAYYYDNTLYAIEGSKLLINERNSDEVIEVDVVEDINNIMVTEDGVIYTSEDVLYIANFDGSLMDQVKFGEKTEDIFQLNNKIYAINDFGKGKNNSILAQISVKSSEKLDKDEVITITKSLNVDKITELKGKRSKLVDIKDDMLFVEQIDSLKSIDLTDLTPGQSYKKEIRKSNGFINNGFMYEFTGNKIVKYDLKTNEEVKGELSISNKYILLNK